MLICGINFIQYFSIDVKNHICVVIKERKKAFGLWNRSCKEIIYLCMDCIQTERYKRRFISKSMKMMVSTSNDKNSIMIPCKFTLCKK